MALRTPALTGHGIDRDDHSRGNPERLSEVTARDDAMLLAMDGLMPVIADNGLTYTPLAEATEGERVYLGLRDGAPIFAPVPAAGDTRPAYEQGANRALVMALQPRDLAIYAGARSLVDWHARHRFCANCGAPTTLAKGGWQRNCASKDDGGCGAAHFPRTDPVAIMLVEHKGSVLLGRGANWPDRAFSALAGFVEPGESIEEAVARETWEEAGVRVRDVSYIASQPWPFPSNLMIGCHGYADDPSITIDTTELEDVRWFTRAECEEAVSKGRASSSFLPPPREAIARTLLDWWLEERG